MKKLLLGLVVCTLGWAGCNSGDNSGGEAKMNVVQKVQMAVTGAEISNAMQKATSYHMNMKSSAMEMDMDVVCPDKMHTQSKTRGMMVEMVRVGDNMYTKSGGKWMKMPTGGKQAAVCGNTATTSGGANSRVPTFDPNVKMTKGGTETVNGETCTDWNGTVTDAKGATHTWTLCVGSDNLPRLMKNADTTITYSNWNKPITIEAPKT